MQNSWVFTCEHGGNQVPENYARVFADAQEKLNSHRGWDPGALQLLNKIEELADFSCSSTTSRLLVELNRSLHHPNLFSDYSKKLSQPEKAQLLEQYYYPYRLKVEGAVDDLLSRQQRIYHLSMHSFTPVLNGQKRDADIGLLYDPKNKLEKAFCKQWKEFLKKELPQFRVRFNYPYKGIADGFTTYLRKKHPFNYAGIEFELNQQWAGQEEVYSKIYASLQHLKQAIG